MVGHQFIPPVNTRIEVVFWPGGRVLPLPLLPIRSHSRMLVHTRLARKNRYIRERSNDKAVTILTPSSCSKHRFLPPHLPLSTNPSPPSPRPPPTHRHLQRQHRLHPPRSREPLSRVSALRDGIVGGVSCDAEVEGAGGGFSEAHGGVEGVEGGVSGVGGGWGCCKGGAYGGGSGEGRGWAVEGIAG